MMTSTATSLSTAHSTPQQGGPQLRQQRNLVTAIPGPRSLELTARKSAAVARGVGISLPIYVQAAGGGVVLDVDGNTLIDLGSGIAVTGVGGPSRNGLAPPPTMVCTLMSPEREHRPEVSLGRLRTVAGHWVAVPPNR